MKSKHGLGSFWYTLYMDAFNAIDYKDQKGDFNAEDEHLLIGLLRDCKPQSVLDVGCGDGLLTKRVKETLPETKITAIDNSAEQIRLAQGLQLQDVGFRLADISTFTEPAEYDCIYSFYAFPHMPKSHVLPSLQTARKLLSANGRFYLFTNIALFDTLAATKEEREACDVTFLAGFSSQINLISLTEMKELIAQSGFHIINDQQLKTGAQVKNYGEMISWLFVLE